MTESGTLARVVFDESHSEAWTIRPEMARAMQPAHPGDSSYARAAAVLAERDFVVMPNVEQPLTEKTLRGAEVLVIAHPSDPRWERTTGTGSPRLSPDEIDAIEAFVAQGGGLIVLGETEQEKYGNNLNELLARFGLHLENDTVQDYEHYRSAPSWILADLHEGGRGRGGDLLARVNAACLYRATTISSSNGATVVARTHATASSPAAPVIVSATHGQGRVVVLADSDLFGDDCIDDLDHRALWVNIVYWVSRAEGGTWPVAAREAGAEQDPAWIRLRDETNALATLQAPDGSLAGDPDAASEHVTRMIRAIEELAPRFPHDEEYLRAVVEDLRAWDFGKPDFTRALGLFRPELQRVDAIEHLVVFPMYKQNGSRETCFEALIIRVPWPDWIAGLERARYDNPKFVPVELIDATRGYDSECAVLFPETVSVAGRPVSNFGAIFCDREAERLRRLAGEAADLLRLNLPPDAACMLASPAISQQAYILWDLIHDRAHSHGDLPFDPFMIRQRAPYWMYSLEELRCDLTAFGQAVELEREGVVVRALRAVLDPARPAAPLPDHGRSGAQLRRAGRAAAVRLPAPARLPALDRQPADDRVGAGGRRGRVAAPRGRGAVPARHRPHQAPALGGGARPGGGERRAGGGLPVDRVGPRVHRRRGSAALHRPRPRRRVPAVDLLLVAKD